MRIFTKIETYLGNEPVVISIGNFDGLHRGHQYLLEKNSELAKAINGRTAVLTFNPHPMQIFKPELFCPIGSPMNQQLGFETLGVDDWIIEPFSLDSKDEEASQFLQRLIRHMPVKGIVVGPDFQFGKNRQGNVNMLQDFCKQNKIDLILPPPFDYQGIRVSSTRIRQLLANGKIELAEELLGHSFAITGKVKPGFHRGRKIGFPTANITSPSAKNLLRGVYLTEVIVRGARFKAATNVGLHPTFGEDTELKIESHILDFQENLYGEEIKVEFKKFIRPEMKFADIKSLVSQIEKDIEFVRES